jgi:DNA-binding transcriptional LysR family regulator
MEPDGRNQLQDWDMWLHAMGLAGLQPAGVLHFSSYDQLISAALAGQGVALGRVPLIQSHLKSRKLVAPFSESVVSPRSYYMLVAPSSAARPEVRAFTDWLVANAEATAPARGRGSGRRPDRAPA